MSAHTPGPWGVTTLNGKPAAGQDSERGGLVAWGMIPADAAYIVRACNAHAGLLAACEAAIPWVAIATGPDPDRHPKAIANAQHDLAALKAAIARARGQ